MCGLAHQRMYHQIRRIGFDDLSGLRLAYNVALSKDVNRWRGKCKVKILTISAPSRALAIAEKYGAPV